MTPESVRASISKISSQHGSRSASPSSTRSRQRPSRGSSPLKRSVPVSTPRSSRSQLSRRGSRTEAIVVSSEDESSNIGQAANIPSAVQSLDSSTTQIFDEGDEDGSEGSDADWASAVSDIRSETRSPTPRSPTPQPVNPYDKRDLRDQALARQAERNGALRPPTTSASASVALHSSDDQHGHNTTTDDDSSSPLTPLAQLVPTPSARLRIWNGLPARSEYPQGSSNTPRARTASALATNRLNALQMAHDVTPGDNVDILLDVVPSISFRMVPEDGQAIHAAPPVLLESLDPLLPIDMGIDSPVYEPLILGSQIGTESDVMSVDEDYQAAGTTDEVQDVPALATSNTIAVTDIHHDDDVESRPPTPPLESETDLPSLESPMRPATPPVEDLPMNELPASIPQVVDSGATSQSIFPSTDTNPLTVDTTREPLTRDETPDLYMEGFEKADEAEYPEAPGQRLVYASPSIVSARLPAPRPVTWKGEGCSTSVLKAAIAATHGWSSRTIGEEEELV